MEAALNRENLDAARAWIQAAKNAEVQAGGPGVWETLRARYRLQRGELDDALLWLAQAAEAFKQLNETTGPRLSSLWAVEAELLCRSGQLEPGIERLQAALSYWLDEAKLVGQTESVARLAPSCPARS